MKIHTRFWQSGARIHALTVRGAKGRSAPAIVRIHADGKVTRLDLGKTIAAASHCV